jgi:RHS repeat-associated protein
MLAAVLVVDPFGLSTVASQAAETMSSETRQQNFSDVLASLPDQPTKPAVELTGSWPASDAESTVLPPAEPPTAAEATVTVPAEADAVVDLGGMTVAVAAAEGGESPDAVTLRVEDAAQTREAGIAGVILDIEGATGGEPDADLTVDLSVSYASFAGLYGGDWASRLRLVRLPDCRAETPTAPQCQPELIPSVNDPDTQTVSGVVPVDDAELVGGQGLAVRTALLGGGSVLAVTAGVSGSAGDWSQTSLPMSSTWGTSGNSGAFTWSYPLPLPNSTSGLAPDLSVSYASSVSDGRVSSTNNQAGWLGEGFDLTASYIERQYTPCAQDQTGSPNNADRETGDLCWGPANASMVFNGAGSTLVKDSGNLWRNKTDDGTRIELLTGGFNGVGAGEYWRVTTTDGTQYFFGRGKVAAGASADLKSAWKVPVYGNHTGEPCFAAADDGGFASSRCDQVWRWNLDHVIDPAGNTITYTYATETNAYVNDYAHNTDWTPISYVSGGRLQHIEYGSRTGATGNAPYKVVFDAQKRCVSDRTDGTSLCANGANETDKTKWVDTPTDLQCSTSAEECPNVVPVFFDTTRLSKVSSQAWDGTNYQPVDTWVFTQRFVGEGDNGQIGQAANVTLRLDKIQRTGHAATSATSDDITLPAVQFGYESLPNRVDNGTDGQSALSRDRVIHVRTESGGAVSVGYRTDCEDGVVPGVTDTAQAANDTLCYLAKWQPEGELEPQNHWFHKYVVESLVEDGAPASSGSTLVTGSASKVTTYEYEGAAWVKPKGPGIRAAEATYSEFRGFKTVRTIVGQGHEAATVDESTYFQGLGDHLPGGPDGYAVTVVDREAYAGQVFTSRTLNAGVPTSETLSKPATPVDVVTAGGLTSSRIPSSTTYGFTFDKDGAVVHRTSTTTTFDAYGLPVTVDDRGDLTTPDDDLCTTSIYRRDGTFTGAHMMSYATKTEVHAASCESTLTNATLISRDSATYDNAGRVTETRAVDPADSADDVVQSKVGYDAAGRVASVEDADGNKTTTAYTTAPGGQLASMTTTSPDPDGLGGTAPFTSTQVFNPLTGLPTSTTDQNGLTTVGTYDALGRPKTLRYPHHEGAPHASVEYAYADPGNGLNAVRTRTLAADGQNQHTTVVLYDGLGRPFQQQADAAAFAAGAPVRMVSHVFYDSAGRTIKQIAPWQVQGAPTMTPVAPDPGPIAQTTYEYDKAGRVTEEVLWSGTDSNPDHEKWRTTTVYDGALTLSIPPVGGIPTETVVDARGRTIELREYFRDPQTHAAAVTVDAVRALVKKTTRYSYTPAGQLKTMTDPKSNQWSYEYDLAGRQTSATDPDGGTTTTSYYPLGQVKTTTNANGDTLAYTYDRLGRPTSLHDGDPGGNVRATWSYDTGTLPDGNQALGQLAAATRVVGGDEYVTSYPAYDTAYRPIQVDTTLPGREDLHALAGSTFTTNYGYTADGQVRQVTYPQVTDEDGEIVLGAETVTTRFDAQSRPSWMGGGFGWGVYVAASGWNPDGSLSGYDLGNTYSVAVGFDWDPVTGQPTNTRMARQGRDGTELNLTYGYDAAGNVTSLIDAPTNTAAVAQKDAQCFQYDGWQRLQVAWTDAHAQCARATVTAADVGGAAPYWTEYAYDSLGNRFSKTDRTGGATTITEYQHGQGDAGPHQLTSMTKTTGTVAVTTGFTWDDAGNQTGRAAGGNQQTHTWDAEGELTAVTGGAEDVSNVYDANGTRLVRIDETGTTVFLPGGQEVRATPVSVTATRWYSFAGNTVAVRTGKGLSGVSSVVTDAHGTPLATVKNTDWKAAVQRIRTDPFGGGRAGQTGMVAGRGFLGAPSDPTGFTLLGARHYDPGTGTFLSVDPELSPGVPAQFNAYVYSGNNPVTWADPSGRNWFADVWKGATKWVDQNKAEIGGLVAGVLVTSGCLALTGGGGSLACFIAGGAAAGAVTNAWKQLQSGKKFDVGSFARDTLTGGALGGVLGPVAGALGKVVAPAVSRFVGAVGNAFKPAVSKLPAAFKPAASAGARPATSGSSNPAAATQGSSFAGVREASALLKEAGVPRQYRKEILESFDRATISVNQAGTSTFGIRFYSSSGVGSQARGRYLTPTLPATRDALALPGANAMSGIAQFQLRPGSVYIAGRVAPAFGHQGGGIQWFVPNLDDLI